MTGWLVALSLCRALDGGTSIAAFNAGAPELTPWMPTQPKWVLAVHISVGTGQTVAIRRLNHEHPKAARVLAGIATGMECAAGTNNLWQLTRKGWRP